MASSSWSALAFLLVMTLPQVILSDMQACNLSSSFSVRISEGRVAKIIGADLRTIIKTENITYTTYPNREEANIMVEDALIAFRGKMIIKYLEDGIESQAARISQTYESQAKGTAKLMRGAGEINHLQECRLSLASKNNFRKGVPPVVDAEIRRLTEYCLGAHLCQLMSTLSLSNFSKPEDQNQERILTKHSRILLEHKISERSSLNNPSSSTYHDTEEKFQVSQEVVNRWTDIVLAEIIETAKKTNGGVIDIPDLDEDFLEGFLQTYGHLEAVDGTFNGITTLKRTKDASLTHVGHKVTASGNFGLSVAQMYYDLYQMKVSFIKVSGRLQADVDGVALDAKISLDYNQRPCTKSLDALRMTHLGALKIQLTGLGPLNYLTSKLVSCVTNMWQSTIAGLVENQIRNILLQKLEELDCERYRL